MPASEMTGPAAKAPAFIRYTFKHVALSEWDIFRNPDSDTEKPCRIATVRTTEAHVQRMVDSLNDTTLEATP